MKGEEYKEEELPELGSLQLNDTKYIACKIRHQVTSTTELIQKGAKHV